MIAIKIVARFRDGRVLKGTTQNFNPAAAAFHLIPWQPGSDAAASPPAKPVSVSFSDLKAVFVVRDFLGRPDYEEKKSFDAEGSGAREGPQLRVTFADGEVMVGRSMNFDPKGMGFFLTPADSESNNQRVFVINSAVKEARLVA